MLYCTVTLAAKPLLNKNSSVKKILEKTVLEHFADLNKTSTEDGVMSFLEIENKLVVILTSKDGNTKVMLEEELNA